MHFSALGIAAVTVLAAPAVFAQAPDPSQVYIRNISYAGSGCPAGSTSQDISPDLKAFTLLFDQFVASAGPGIALPESRKNCQITVDLVYPQGWSYTVFSADYRGYASLTPGSTGTPSI